MVRTRILAALLVLPLTACEMSGDATSQGTQKTDELSDVTSSLASMPGAEVVGRHDDGVPFLIRGRLGTVDSAVRGFAGADSVRAVSSMLPSIAGSFRLRAEDLVVSRVSVDEQGFTHIRYNQMKNGLPVVGQELAIHLDPEGNIVMANGSARDGEFGVPATARIAAQSAKTAALRNTVGTRLEIDGQPRLVYLRAGQAQKLTLAYEVVVTGEGAQLPIRDHVFVDATTGVVADRVTDIHSALNRAVYSANNGSSLPGTLRRSEGGATTGDAHIDQNYDQLGFTYNCYKTIFNRDSYNNAGAQLKSSVHYSTNYVNAYWNGSQMVYGDGDGVNSGMLGKDADVTVHELTHAVTSSESNLTYSNESGALNEGMSDIFAAVCESWSTSWSTSADVWMIGEDIWTPGTAGDALRYMANPTQDGSSKDYYPERYTGTSDNGGVHWNSGIANLAFKLLATGGTHPRGKTTVSVTGVGVEVAARIFYKANTDLFTASTTFAQAKTYTVTAASQLGYSAAIQDSVTKAWEAVGVGVTTPPPACTLLTNGVATTGISGASGSQKFYCIDVPASKASSFVLSGGTGDADMYVKYNAAPTTSSYDCRPYLSGNNESCSIAAKTTAGRFYIMLNGYSTYSGVSLKATY
ncbi:M4 family metallopeptidase [Pyxidicoccus sp. MSG2]|uniref:M4 family metallopeptidase n=1 Tax=Pyxidicoccus sp. MSG2 TaxID=2996790 RepID=UPI00227135C8|nr:M4 family metallopeptidase [Pyxidicoccus sp. MSG2]MCY1015070.1 M4 family metallopeptidase [Pyxidicoccus sp. MSG2]